VYNPEPVAPFFDAILIGEGEEALGEIVAAHRAAKASGLSRAEVLRALSRVPGVYVPSLYDELRDDAGAYVGTQPIAGSGAPRVVENASSPTLTPRQRRSRASCRSWTSSTTGTASRCCAAARAAAVSAKQGWSIGQYGSAAPTPSFAMWLRASPVPATTRSASRHSPRPTTASSRTSCAVCSGGSKAAASAISLPSLRVDAFGVEMARLVSAGGKKSGLTFAPRGWDPADA